MQVHFRLSGYWYVSTLKSKHILVRFFFQSHGVILVAPIFIFSIRTAWLQQSHIGAFKQYEIHWCLWSRSGKTPSDPPLKTPSDASRMRKKCRASIHPQINVERGNSSMCLCLTFLMCQTMVSNGKHICDTIGFGAFKFDSPNSLPDGPEAKGSKTTHRRNWIRSLASGAFCVLLQHF